MIELLALAWKFRSELTQYGPTIIELVNLIVHSIEEAKKRKLAEDFEKGFQNAIETGDASFLHAVIDAHPNFRMRLKPSNPVQLETVDAQKRNAAEGGPGKPTPPGDGSGSSGTGVPH